MRQSSLNSRSISSSESSSVPSSMSRSNSTLPHAGLTSFLILCFSCIPKGAQAHSFGQTFTLPVPFELYAWASSATLILTFLLMGLKGYLSRGELVALTMKPDYEFEDISRRSLLSVILAGLSIALFVLAVYSGIAGTQRRTDNLNMTYFWIIWMLGLAYLSGITTNVWKTINPFLAICQLWDALLKIYHREQWKKPKPLELPDAWLHTLALVWLFVFAAYELFGNSKPFDLSVLLLVYLVYIFAGSQLVGLKVFSQKACFFSMYFELLGRCGKSLRGMLTFSTPTEPHLLTHFRSVVPALFVVALFSTTALDGLLDTEYWYKTVWPDFARMYAEVFRPDLVSALNNPLLAAREIGPMFKALEKAMLFLAPVSLALAFFFALFLAQQITKTKFSVWQLAQAFAPTLMPIVLVYSFSHYFTLLLTQGVQFAHLLSDPMGRGWNIFGTYNLWRAPVLLDAQLIWNIQVTSILIGHMVSAMASHSMAFKLFTNKKHANLSQVPMLMLMIGLTLFGLWILSQPLQMGT
jgi:hypothetical protein